MAQQSSFYNTDGSTRTYPSSKHIASKQHVAVYFKSVSTSTWAVIEQTLYDLVNNSIVFTDAPDNALYSEIEIRVADTAAELTESPSDIATVAGSIASVNTVAGAITSVETVSGNIAAVSTVSGAIANVNTVGGSIANVNTVATNVANVNTVATNVANVNTVVANIANVNTVATNVTNVNTVVANISDVNTVATNIADVVSVADTIVPNIAEILLADTNAATATTQAGIATTKAGEASTSATDAQLRAWEAEAERLTADSYATEAEDVFVKVYTSNGDGTFTATNTAEYSALHWRNKAALIAVGQASNISVTPTGNISSTNVQNALAEIDSEKAIDSSVVHLSGVETIAGNKTFSGTNTFIGNNNSFTGTGNSFSSTVFMPNISYKNTPVSITSWSYVGTTITLNVASHTFVAGDYIEVSGLTATTNIPNGVHLVTSVTPTTIVYTLAATPTGTAGVSSATVKGYTTINGRISGSVGAGQTWQNVTASRALGTTYTNTTGRPIIVHFQGSGGAANGVVCAIDGVNGQLSSGSTTTFANGLDFVVPHGSTYRISAAAGSPTLTNWYEYR